MFVGDCSSGIACGVGKGGYLVRKWQNFPIVPQLCCLWQSQLFEDLFKNVVPVNEILPAQALPLLTATDCPSSVTFPHRDYMVAPPLVNPTTSTAAPRTGSPCWRPRSRSPCTLSSRSGHLRVFSNSTGPLGSQGSSTLATFSSLSRSKIGQTVAFTDTPFCCDLLCSAVGERSGKFRVLDAAKVLRSQRRRRSSTLD